MLELLEEKANRARRANRRERIDCYYPDQDIEVEIDGALRTFHARDKYGKHLEFFKLGATEWERFFMAANRVGKTEGGGGYEITRHLLGDYPEWWPGHRSKYPVDTWAAGDTSQTVRDIQQRVLLGPPGQWGTGLIPENRIVQIRRKGGGVPDSVESIQVRHASGGTSLLGFKSYDQRRVSFQGTKKHVIWADEEPPWDVYLEMRLRCTDTQGGAEPGLIMGTFTPLSGMSEVAMYAMGVDMSELEAA